MAVANGTCGVERSPALTNLLHDVVLTNDPEVGVLLTSEGSIWQVFSSCRGAHSNGNFATAQGHQVLVCLNNLETYCFRNFLGEDELTNERGLAVNLGRVVIVETFEVCLDLVVQLGVVHHRVKGVGGDGESGRHGHTCTGHNRQRGALSTQALVLRSLGAIERERVQRHCVFPFEVGVITRRRVLRQERGRRGCLRTQCQFRARIA